MGVMSSYVHSPLDHVATLGGKYYMQYAYMDDQIQ